MPSLRRAGLPGFGPAGRRLRPTHAALLAACLLITGACVATPPGGAATATPAPALDPVFIPRELAGTETPTPTPPPALDEAGVATLLRTAVCWSERTADARTCVPPGPEVVAAIETIALSGDRRFLAPLVDMLSLDVGWGRFVREALERISGTGQPDVNAWYSWLADEQPPLPSGYANWKGRLLSLVDRRFTDLVNERLGDGVRPDELVWSGVGVDELPPLDAPSTILAVEQRYLDDGDVVFGLSLDGEPRAYPERILGWHGLVSDGADTSALVIAYCVPCGSAAAFGATASDGRDYTFGTSGLVYRSRQLLFDERTFSLWDPVSGAAIAGPLATDGVHLTPLPLLRTTWGHWRERQPDTAVLSLDTGSVRDYAEGAALQEDAAAAAPLFPAGVIDERLPPGQRVLGVTIGGEARAYPIEAVERSRLVHDRLGGQDIVLVTVGPGHGVAVFDESDVHFATLGGDIDALELTDGDGLRWFMNERRLLNSRNGRLREALPAITAYWFAWSGAFPDTTVWSE